jgi:hypothetical protein
MEGFIASDVDVDYRSRVQISRDHQLNVLIGERYVSVRSGISRRIWQSGAVARREGFSSRRAATRCARPARIRKIGWIVSWYSTSAPSRADTLRFTDSVRVDSALEEKVRRPATRRRLLGTLRVNPPPVQD